MPQEQREKWNDLQQLTPQECMLLFYLCQKESNEGIAAKLHVVLSTFYKYFESLCGKLHVDGLPPTQRRATITMDYCPLFLGKAHSGETAWKDLRTEGAQPRSSSTAGEQQKAQAGGGPTASDSKAEGAHGSAASDSTAQSAQGSAGADSAAQNARGSADADSTAQSAHKSADADSAGKKAHGPTDGDSATQSAQGTAGADSTAQSAHGTAQQGGTSGRSPDLGPLEPNERPQWLWPVLLLVAIVLVGVGIIIGMLLGRGPSTTPVPFATSTPGTSAYSASPTQAPVYASPRTTAPIPAAPTISDVQNPAPGSVIPAGQAFSRSGVTVTARRDLDISRNYVSPFMEIRNGGSDQLFVRWKPSFFHLQDSAGRVYHQMNDDTAAYNDVIQFTLAPGESMTLHGSDVYALSSLGYQTFGWFLGPIDPSVKQLDFKVDEIASLTSLTWRFSLP